MTPLSSSSRLLVTAFLATALFAPGCSSSTNTPTKGGDGGTDAASGDDGAIDAAVANACATANGGCDPLTTCTDVDGVATCGACPTGYTGSGLAGCKDIDECASNNGGCDPHTTCTNTPGGRGCGACPVGTTGDGASGCLDVNECATANGGCDAHTTCTNTFGSRLCSVCPSGYLGDGYAGCVDVNECLVNNGGCDPLTTCTNLDGSFACADCPTGYTRVGVTCVDVNECLVDNGGCDALTTCTNYGGGRTCGACPVGYDGTGATSCTDVDECATGNGGCDPLRTCQNTPGSRTCGACPTGYVENGATGCSDVNECLLNNGGCDPTTTCTNTAGGRTCGACPAGYAGTGDTGCSAIACTDGTDPSGDTMTITFDVNRFQLPNSSTGATDGLDVDGVASANASEPNSCFTTDTKPVASSPTANVDNQIPGLANSLTSAGVSLSSAFQSTVGDPTRTMAMQIRVRQWNGTLDDPCVVVDLLTGSGPTLASPVVVGTATTSLTAGVSPTMKGFAPFSLTTTISSIPAGYPATYCNLYYGGGTTQTGCTRPIDCSADVTLTIDGLMLRLNVQPQLGGGFQLVTNRPLSNASGVANPTLLAGHLYAWDTTSGPANCSATPAPGTFGAQLHDAVCELGYGSYWQSYVCSPLLSALDLHSQPDGMDRSLTTCTGTTHGNGNENSVSIGVYVGSGY